MSDADDEGLVTLLGTYDPVEASRLVDLLESRGVTARLLTLGCSGGWCTPVLTVVVLARDLREQEPEITAALAQLREELGPDAASIAW